MIESTGTESLLDIINIAHCLIKPWIIWEQRNNGHKIWSNKDKRLVRLWITKYKFLSFYLMWQWTDILSAVWTSCFSGGHLGNFNLFSHLRCAKMFTTCYTITILYENMKQYAFSSGMIWFCQDIIPFALNAIWTLTMMKRTTRKAARHIRKGGLSRYLNVWLSKV